MKPRRHPGDGCGCASCAAARVVFLWREAIVWLCWRADGMPALHDAGRTVRP